MADKEFKGYSRKTKAQKVYFAFKRRGFCPAAAQKMAKRSYPDDLLDLWGNVIKKKEGDNGE